MVIDAGLMPMVILALDQGKFRIQDEAAWAIGNFAVGGTEEQVRFLWIHVGIDIPPPPSLLPSLGVVLDIRRCHSCDVQFSPGLQRSSEWCQGVKRKQHYNLSPSPFDQTIEVILEGLWNVLEKSKDDRKVVVSMIEESGGEQKLEELQMHEEQSICKMASNIFNKYFSKNVSE